MQDSLQSMWPGAKLKSTSVYLHYNLLHKVLYCYSLLVSMDSKHWLKFVIFTKLIKNSHNDWYLWHNTTHAGWVCVRLFNQSTPCNWMLVMGSYWSFVTMNERSISTASNNCTNAWSYVKQIILSNQTRMKHRKIIHKTDCEMRKTELRHNNNLLMYKILIFLSRDRKLRKQYLKVENT